MDAPRPKIPIRVPAFVAIGFMIVVAVCIGYLWPALLTMKIREKLRGGSLYAVAGLFALVTLGFAGLWCAMVLPETDYTVLYRMPLARNTLYVTPALLAWGASAFAWAGLGGLGSLVALGSAIAWGLKPVYAGWSTRTNFWSEDNPTFYGAGMGLVAVAAVLAVYQVRTLRGAGSALR